MKHNILFILMLILISCKGNKNDAIETDAYIDSTKVDSVIIPIPNNNSTIKDETFKVHKSRAILLGEKIELCDENGKVIKDITHLNETIVEVLAKSTKLNHYKDIKDCNEYYWVKIIADKEIGYVDGNKLYEPYEHKLNQKIKFGSNEISITLTKTMGQREYDETQDPLYCFSDKPIIFKDTEANYEGILKTVKNKYSEKNNHYFAIFNDDMAGDEVTKIEKIDNKYILSILRGYQEGGANMKVTIYKDDKNKFVAEILEYKSIEEEELQRQLKQ